MIVPRWKDHTVIGLININKKTGECKITNTEIYFKDINYYTDFPDPCKCPEVKEDFERFKQDQQKKDMCINA